MRRTRRWHAVAAGAAALVLIAAGCSGSESSDEPDDTEANDVGGDDAEDRHTTVLEFRRESEFRPWRDDELIELLRGPVTIDPLFATAADCANGRDWLADHSLNTSVLLSTREDLVTAARLIATGQVRPDVAREVEEAFWQAGGDVDSVAAAVAELDDEPRELAQAYLDARAEAPSGEDAERYGVYVVSVTIWEQYVVYFDAAALEEDDFEEYVDRGLPREIRRPDSAGGTVAVPLQSCDDVIDHWSED